MTAEGGPPGGRVRPIVALALATAGFFAVTIFGLGMTSLILDADVIAVRSLGQAPGVTGMIFAVAAFAGVLWMGVRAPHPSYWTAPVAAVAAYLAELVGIVAGAIFSGSGPARAISAAAGVATDWFGVVIGVAALASAWAGIALVRTGAERPRWPWERDDSR